MREPVPGDRASERMPVRAVQRAFDLLARIGTRKEGATLSELARDSGLPTSTAARLIASLEQTGFVERDADARYRSGPRLLQVGLSALHGSTLYELSEPFLRRLSQASGETANLAIPIDAHQAIYLRQEISPKSIHHATWVGRILPLDRTAVGGALLGRAGAAGYVAMRDTLERDVTAVAAPVHDARGRIVAALSITGPSFRISDDDLVRFGKLVADAARAASLQLGAPGALLAETPEKGGPPT
ncbi:MAG TPA: IclR family transcriptional regulator [Zeimonas sp.]|nr:IclR family transcriptional regulator [Zeimonas sp.]